MAPQFSLAIFDTPSLHLCIFASLQPTGGVLVRWKSIDVPRGFGCDLSPESKMLRISTKSRLACVKRPYRIEDCHAAAIRRIYE